LCSAQAPPSAEAPHGHVGLIFDDQQLHEETLVDFEGIIPVSVLGALN